MADTNNNQIKLNLSLSYSNVLTSLKSIKERITEIQDIAAKPLELSVNMNAAIESNKKALAAIKDNIKEWKKFLSKDSESYKNFSKVSKELTAITNQLVKIPVDFRSNMEKAFEGSISDLTKRIEEDQKKLAKLQKEHDAVTNEIHTVTKDSPVDVAKVKKKARIAAKAELEAQNEVKSSARENSEETSLTPKKKKRRGSGNALGIVSSTDNTIEETRQKYTHRTPKRLGISGTGRAKVVQPIKQEDTEEIIDLLALGTSASKAGRRTPRQIVNNMVGKASSVTKHQESEEVLDLLSLASSANSGRAGHSDGNTSTSVPLTFNGPNISKTISEINEQILDSKLSVNIPITFSHGNIADVISNIKGQVGQAGESIDVPVAIKSSSGTINAENKIQDLLKKRQLLQDNINNTIGKPLTRQRYEGDIAKMQELNGELGKLGFKDAREKYPDYMSYYKDISGLNAIQKEMNSLIEKGIAPTKQRWEAEKERYEGLKAQGLSMKQKGINKSFFKPFDEYFSSYDNFLGMIKSHQGTASVTANVGLNATSFNEQVGRVIAQLNKLKQDGNIPIHLNTSQLSADLDRVYRTISVLGQAHNKGEIPVRLDLSRLTSDLEQVHSTIAAIEHARAKGNIPVHLDASSVPAEVEKLSAEISKVPPNISININEAAFRSRYAALRQTVERLEPLQLNAHVNLDTIRKSLNDIRLPVPITFNTINADADITRLRTRLNEMKVYVPVGINPAEAYAQMNTAVKEIHKFGPIHLNIDKTSIIEQITGLSNEIRSINSTIKVLLDTKEAHAQLTSFAQEMGMLGNESISIKLFGVAAAMEEIELLAKQIQAIKDMNVSLPIKPDLTSFTDSLEALKGKLQKFYETKKYFLPEINADTKPFKEKLSTLRTLLDDFQKNKRTVIEIKADIAKAKAEIDKLVSDTKIKEISDSKEIKIEANATQFLETVDKCLKELAKLKDVTVNINGNLSNAVGKSNTKEPDALLNEQLNAEWDAPKKLTKAQFVKKIREQLSSGFSDGLFAKWKDNIDAGFSEYSSKVAEHALEQKIDAKGDPQQDTTAGRKGKTAKGVFNYNQKYKEFSSPKFETYGVQHQRGIITTLMDAISADAWKDHPEDAFEKLQERRSILDPSHKATLANLSPEEARQAKIDKVYQATGDYETKTRSALAKKQYDDREKAAQAEYKAIDKDLELYDKLKRKRDNMLKTGQNRSGLAKQELQDQENALFERLKARGVNTEDSEHPLKRMWDDESIAALDKALGKTTKPKSANNKVNSPQKEIERLVRKLTHMNRTMAAAEKDGKAFSAGKWFRYGEDESDIANRLKQLGTSLEEQGFKQMFAEGQRKAHVRRAVNPARETEIEGIVSEIRKLQKKRKDAEEKGKYIPDTNWNNFDKTEAELFSRMRELGANPLEYKVYRQFSPGQRQVHEDTVFNHSENVRKDWAAAHKEHDNELKEQKVAADAAAKKEKKQNEEAAKKAANLETANAKKAVKDEEDREKALQYEQKTRSMLAAKTQKTIERLNRLREYLGTQEVKGAFISDKSWAGYANTEKRLTEQLTNYGYKDFDNTPVYSDANRAAHIDKSIQRIENRLNKLLDQYSMTDNATPSSYNRVYTQVHDLINAIKKMNPDYKHDRADSMFKKSPQEYRDGYSKGGISSDYKDAKKLLNEIERDMMNGRGRTIDYIDSRKNRIDTLLGNLREYDPEGYNKLTARYSEALNADAAKVNEKIIKSIQEQIRKAVDSFERALNSGSVGMNAFGGRQSRIFGLLDRLGQYGGQYVDRIPDNILQHPDDFIAKTLKKKLDKRLQQFSMLGDNPSPSAYHRAYNDAMDLSEQIYSFDSNYRHPGLDKFQLTPQEYRANYKKVKSQDGEKRTVQQIQEDYNNAIAKQNELLTYGTLLSQKQVNAEKHKLNVLKEELEAAQKLNGVNTPIPRSEMEIMGYDAHRINSSIARGLVNGYDRSAISSISQGLQEQQAAHEIVGTAYLSNVAKEKFPLSFNKATKESSDLLLKNAAHIRALSKEHERLQKVVSGTTEKVGSLSHKLKNHLSWLGSGMIIGSAFAIPTGTIDKLKELEFRLAGIQQVMPSIETWVSDANREFNKLNQISQKFGVSTADTMEAAKSIGRMYGKDSLDKHGKPIPGSGELKTNIVTHQAAKMAVADAFDMTTAYRGLEAALSQWNLQSEDANELMSNSNRIIEAWTIAAHSGAASAQDIGNAIEIAGTAAAQAGISFEFFNALVATGVRQTARSGSEIGNAIKAMTVTMQSEKSKKALAEWGIEIYNIAEDGTKSMRSMEDVILDLSLMLNNTEKNANSLLMTLSGGKQSASRSGNAA